MKTVQIKNVNVQNLLLTIAATALSSACVQPQIESPPANPTPSISSGKPMVNNSPNRIMARLDGLTGEADPRLVSLRKGFAQLGMTVLAMGVSPSAAQTGAATGSKYSAFIVVTVDASKVQMSSAITQVRALENFAYVEVDQLQHAR